MRGTSLLLDMLKKRIVLLTLCVVSRYLLVDTEWLDWPQDKLHQDHTDSVFDIKCYFIILNLLPVTISRTLAEKQGGGPEFLCYLVSGSFHCFTFSINDNHYVVFPWHCLPCFQLGGNCLHLHPSTPAIHTETIVSLKNLYGMTAAGHHQCGCQYCSCSWMGANSCSLL